MGIFTLARWLLSSALLSLLWLGTGLAAPGPATIAQSPGNCDGAPGVYLYELPGYQGRCTRFVQDHPNLAGTYVGDNAVSSIRIIGVWSASLFAQADYQGEQSLFSHDNPDLSDDVIGRSEASSIRVQSGSEGPVCTTAGTFCAHYFGNRSLSGSPLLMRSEGAIDHQWGTDAPGPAVPADNFSARWVGRFNFAASTYTFVARSDDGIRVWVDNILILDRWLDQQVTEYRVERYLGAGEHEIRVEYYEAVGGATVQVRWEALCPDGQYRAQYFGNRELSGAPLLARCESAIDYDWGNGAPSSVIPADNFSARWTGRFGFAAADYSFIARTDDGLRLWVDGSLILDKWFGQPSTEYVVRRTMTAGLHDIRVEYFEGAGNATARVRWQQGCPSGQFQARYFNNRELAGSAILTRCETGIQYDWGSGGPGSGVANDSFSARWVGRFMFPAGTYEFIARTDDGMRAWLDGDLIMDHWNIQSVTEYRVQRAVAAGEHEVLVEYFEADRLAVARFEWVASLTTNLALHRQAMATSQESELFPPQNGNDGNVATRWSSRIWVGNEPQWWWIDLGGQTFDQARVTWNAAYGAQHCLLWSNDGIDWTGNAYELAEPGLVVYDLGDHSARYVGLYMHGLAPNMNNYSIQEFELYRVTASSGEEGSRLPHTPTVPCTRPPTAYPVIQDRAATSGQ